jgi:hypothetical protein
MIRAIVGIISLLVVMLIISLLVKKQMSATTQPVPACAPDTSPSCRKSDDGQLPQTQREQAQQAQQQIKQAFEAAQKARPDLEEAVK